VLRTVCLPLVDVISGNCILNGVELSSDRFGSGAVMDWFCFEDKLYAGDWRVEGRDYGNDGRVYVIIFSGPNAHERALEYVNWKTESEVRRPFRKAG
jgi:hypothetical protein